MKKYVLILSILFFFNLSDNFAQPTMAWMTCLLAHGVHYFTPPAPFVCLGVGSLGKRVRQRKIHRLGRSKNYPRK